MAKLEDKLFNRVIEGKLDAKEEIDSEAVKAVEGAESGTVASVLGLDSNGKLVKGAVSGGTQLYQHHIVLTTGGEDKEYYIINFSNQALSKDSQFSQVVGKQCLSAFDDSAGTSGITFISVIDFMGVLAFYVQYTDGNTYDVDVPNITNWVDTVTPL